MTDADVSTPTPSLPGVHALRAIGRRPRLVVLVWALVITAAAVAHYRAQSPVPFMPTRMDGISQSIAVLDRGGPPLLGSDIPYSKGIATSHLFVVGAPDDQGIYLYLPVLGHLTGEKNPAVLMEWFYTGTFALLIFLIPLIAFELFGGLFAFLAPLLVLWQFDRVEGMDLYWIMAWIMLLGLPALLLAYRWWCKGLRRRATAAMVGLAVAAGFASSIRAEAGLAVLLGALGVVLLTGTDRWRRPRTWRLARPNRATVVTLLTAAALLVVYLSFSSFSLAAVRDYRNAVIHDSSFGTAAPTQHPLWHNAYIGLGYLPNPYGIEYADQVSIDLVQRNHPGATYLSSAYEAALRSAYFHIAFHNPGFFIHDIWVKTRTIVGDALKHFWLAPILVALGLLIRRRRKETLVVLALAAPALVLGAASPVLTTPITRYSLGWLGAVGAVWLLSIGWTIAELTAAYRNRSRAPLTSTLRSRPALILAAVAVVTIAVTATATPAAPPFDKHYFAANATAFTTAPPGTRKLAAWRFAGALPHGWQTVGATKLQLDTDPTGKTGLYIRTGMTPSQTAVEGPAVLLRPGKYAVVGNGNVIAGGLGLGVRDAKTGRVLARSRYWWGQGNYVGQPLTTTFTLRSPTQVKVSLDNWTPYPNASAWVVSNIALARILPPAVYYAPRATPLTPPSALNGTRLRSWPFIGATPQGWEGVAKGASGGPVPGGLEVITSPGPSAPQLRGAPLLLPVGNYAVVLAGSVEEGGLQLDVVDALHGGAPLATSRFWSGQHFGGPDEMAATFTLTRPASVGFVLSNWAPSASSSRWIVRRFDLLQLR